MKKGIKQVKCKGLSMALQVAEHEREASCGVILYDKESGAFLEKRMFSQEDYIGRVRLGSVENVDRKQISYRFFIQNTEERMVTDPNAQAYQVTGMYGKSKADDDFRAFVPDQSYDWEGACSPRISYHESILYGLHVRGFTKHDSSGVIAKGTFAGVAEKITYLKDLGITGIELQPCYEFDEMDGERLNYWGYKQGYYYAPKSAYAYTDDAVGEFKDMVKALHRQQMEVILQFYFPDNFPTAEIVNVLRFWTYTYRVDGFHLMGNRIPIEMLAEDPCLADVKLISDRVPREAAHHYLAHYDDSFRRTGRQLLKGDEGVLQEFLACMCANPAHHNVINYFADHAGFTMMDMVSYNQKHNMSNCEQGMDGTDRNYSWNCGVEGPTENEEVNSFRRKQLCNAFVMLMLSQGTPYLFMGDEFGNSQIGNNNPYCQDNQITWLDWGDLEKNKDIYSFVQEMIRIRRDNKIFRQEEACILRDYKSCGYPDLSYHNELAWKPIVNQDTRHMGVMLCGNYVEGCEGLLVYIALNMHWETRAFALPRLSAGKVWKRCLTTEKGKEKLTPNLPAGTKGVVVRPRSITVYTVGELR